MIGSKNFAAIPGSTRTSTSTSTTSLIAVIPAKAGIQCLSSCEVRR